MTLLTARALRVGYEARGLLPALSLDITAGEMWAVLGPNGAGKSTLLKTLLGLMPAVGGRVERAAHTHPAYVPQQANLDPIFPVRVLEFVLMGRLRASRWARPPGGEDRARAHAALERTGAAGLDERLLRDLSGGQRQRVLVARALASEANLFFLDEPTSALDVAAERAVLDLIDGLRRDGQAAVVMVTHLVGEAVRRADRILLLDRERGAALAGPAAELVRSPAFEALYGPAPAPVSAPGGAT